MHRSIAQEISAVRQPILSSFFLQEDVVGLAKMLLGKVLVSFLDDTRTSGIIVETEAYRAPDDKASHAYNYRRTARTEVMYKAGGTAYVYLIYGIHHLFNVVTGPSDIPHAILIRAIEPLENIEKMMHRRKMRQPEKRLTAGPGVLSQAMGIKTSHTGVSLVEESGIWLEEDPKLQIANESIIESPRVGIDYAAEWAKVPWRFRVKDNPWTSKG